MKNLKQFTTILFFSLLLLFVIFSCNPGKLPVTITKENNQETFMNPPVIIYKTKKDYYFNIPVGLSDDKLSVISYPDKVDIYHNGILATPTLLANGYLLDNRGIGLNTAFTKYTYSEFSQLASTPMAETLFLQIIDFDPLMEIYSCKCNRYTAVINRLIREGLNENCKKLK
jgi:hypothetical protein